MIIVNELRIKDKYLKINLEIDDSDYYTDCTFDKVEIQTHRDYLVDMDEPTVTIEATEATGGDKSFVYDIELNRNIIDIKENDLIFIKVYWEGTPAINAPCDSDINPFKYVVYDRRIVYSLGMKYIGELADCCADKDGAINFILHQKYFELSLKSWDLLNAIKLWESFTSDNIVTPLNSCGCNG